MSSCSVQGHKFSVVSAEGEDDPILVVCANCGQRWELLPLLSETPVSPPAADA